MKFYAFKTEISGPRSAIGISLRIGGYKSLETAKKAADRAIGGYVTDQQRNFLYVSKKGLSQVYTE